MSNGSALAQTTIICALAALLGHVLLGFNYGLNWGWPWEPVVGGSIAIVAVVGFGGFYLASRRARVAIASGFILTFLVMLTYMLTIGALADNAAQGAAKDLLADFRDVVTVVVGFYFVSEGAVGVTKVLAAAKPESDQAEVQSADRDLVDPAPQSDSPASANR